jgi:TPR repeat protein
MATTPLTDVAPPSSAARADQRSEEVARKPPILVAPTERERAERLVARGERDLADGNVALARQFFLHAAKAGLARGAFLLATTYDPRELARLAVFGVQPNVALARQWYERARELGATEAHERLVGLTER